ncbi:carbohydrate ABC transporter permease [Ruminiclostridium cellulolyticum]|uniref:Binding-protein-dependent transport systems inner membrane component n=1 Tax=Ruminiclostridium cellulolyticum (strain ATCC 35319 / DSM 5812 / JCM 6584 / H10) TaxID=394503 RepID=B8I0X8_RUMCH|nr:sugar ABC transporter permease [Ruminiclostridium cellulolyticum]ACL77534.1 binding-protein-dependent transport systems inner membrane component [Ruminiclostridium cellulolyticum H10]
MAKNKGYIALFLLPTLVLFLIVYTVSIAILFSTSFTEWSTGTKPVFIGLKNYIDMFTNDSDFRRSLLNTCIWIFLQSTVHVVIGVLFAIILNMKEFYWKFARTVFMIPNIISGAAVGMLFLCILNPEFGAVNSIVRLLGFEDFSQNWFMDHKTSFFSVTMTWLPYAAIVTILVLAEIAAIPEGIYEAARIDGANEVKINIYIVLPLLRNIIGTCVILSGTSMLQKLDIIVMTTGGGPGNLTMNLPMYIYKTALMDNNFGYSNAIGSFLVVFGIMLVLLYRRIFKIGSSEV